MTGMDLAFVHAGYPGQVRISCVPNDTPAAVGTPEWARGFPVCTATVSFAGRGYHALFGWVQLVRSTDNASQGAAFELDPFALFADSPAPYCWYGATPTLFDAPCRAERRSLHWLAHSFLATTPLAPRAKRVVPVVGFAWGFSSDAAGGVTLLPLRPLAAADWHAHLPLLRQAYPNWAFADHGTQPRDAG